MKRRAWLLSMAIVASLLTACSKVSTSPPKPPAQEELPPLPTPDTPQAGGIPTPSDPPQPKLVDGPIHLLGDTSGPWPTPILVAVSNVPDARPQAGVATAPLVIESLAEGEVTRWWTFVNHQAEQIGPVRSARIYAVEIAEAYQTAIAHAGGSVDALQALKKPGAKDLDEIYTYAPAFYRSKDRPMPNNLWTSFDLLDKAIHAKAFKLPQASTTPQQHIQSPDIGSIKAVDVSWHSLHQVEWKWEGTSYRRYSNGKPHPLLDADALLAANLIFMDVSGTYRGPDSGWVLDFGKGGAVTVVTEGHQWSGKWEFGTGGFRLMPDSPVPPLAPGLTWVHLITDWSSYEFKTE